MKARRDFSRNEPGDFFDTRLSELFTEGKDELIVQHMMYAPEAEAGCPMCSMWADAFDAVAPHLNDRTNFVIIARADIATLRDWARRRGWRNVRLLSSHDCAFNQDYNVEIEPARQLPAVSVFVRSGDGAIHHSYMTEASLVENPPSGHRLLLACLESVGSLYPRAAEIGCRSRSTTNFWLSFPVAGSINRNVRTTPAAVSSDSERKFS